MTSNKVYVSTSLKNKSRFKALDSLRGIFILIIVIYHVSLTPYFGDGSLPLKIYNRFVGFCYAYGGMCGNAFFFMLSGFVLNHVYSERISLHDTVFRDYIWSRLKKIYPSFVISNLFSLVLARIQYGAGSVPIEDILTNLNICCFGWYDNTYFYNGPTWFASVLLICYILYYVLYWLTGRNHRLRYAVLIGLIIIGVFLQNHTFDFPFLYQQNGEGIANFFVGVLIYNILTCSNIKRVSVISQVMAAFLITLTVLVSITIGIENISIKEENIFTFIVCPSVITLAILNRYIESFLSLKIFRLFSYTSLAVYFFHLPLKYLYNIILYGYVDKIGYNYHMLIYLAMTYIFCFAYQKSLDGVTKILKR